MGFMKVASVERVHLNLPFRDEPERNMARQLNNWHMVEVCRVTAENGLTGYGETLPHATWGRVTDEAVSQVKGKNPFQLMWDDSLGAGLQMALFDLAAKSAGVPIHRLLGNKVRDRCPVSWWSIDMPPEDLGAEMRVAVDQGYLSAKLKARPWFDIHKQMAAVCSVVPPSFRLTLDFNGLLRNAGAALPVMKDLERYSNISVLETPIPQGDVAGHKELSLKTGRPIAMHYGLYGATPAVQLGQGVCDAFVVGGGAGCVMGSGAALREFNKPFWLQMVGTGITTAFALHLGAVLSHARLPAVTCMDMFAHQLVRDPFTVQAGCCRVPDSPGLGVVVDEKALQDYSATSSAKENLRAVYAVVRANGEHTYYARARQYLEDFLNGTGPVFERGMHLEVLPDDGTATWEDLYGRAQAGPVRSSTALLGLSE